MPENIIVLVPELGDFAAVPVIEILVAVGDEVDIESPLVTLESDKATMDVPSSHAGTVARIAVTLGDNIQQGDAIVELIPPTAKVATSPAVTADAVADDVAADDVAADDAAADDAAADDVVADDVAADDVAADDVANSAVADDAVDLVVIGAGPGGYTAAFRAADLGLNTVLIERYPDLGGVCLNVGCIPSKALLHSAKIITEAAEAKKLGIHFNQATVDSAALAQWKNKVVSTLTGGLNKLAKQRKVTVIQGLARFTSTNSLVLEQPEQPLGKQQSLRFKHAIIATGSRAVKIANFPHDDPRLIDSTGALQLDDIPKKMLIIGGGIIGLELATVYHALGSEISIVERADSLIADADADLVRPLQRRIAKQYKHIWLRTEVTAITAQKNGLEVAFAGAKAPPFALFDKVLVAVGRAPNGDSANPQAAGVAVTAQGFINVDAQQRTNQPHIFAIGDVVSQPMLAHKATHEGKVAAEVIAGLASGFDGHIPSVAYTDPEVAWVGLTENQAQQQAADIGIGKFPWAASGRALSLNRSEGLTKLLFDKQSGKIIGCGIVGPNAGDLIAEATLAIEMGADAQDLSLTIHPHPTLSETLGLAAEAFEGTITDLYMPKKQP